jgi:hypothetical protein
MLHIVLLKSAIITIAQDSMISSTVRHHTIPVVLEEEHRSPLRPMQLTAANQMGLATGLPDRFAISQRRR